MSDRSALGNLKSFVAYLLSVLLFAMPFSFVMPADAWAQSNSAPSYSSTGVTAQKGDRDSSHWSDDPTTGGYVETVDHTTDISDQYQFGAGQFLWTDKNTGETTLYQLDIGGSEQQVATKRSLMEQYGYGAMKDLNADNPYIAASEACFLLGVAANFLPNPALSTSIGVAFTSLSNYMLTLDENNVAAYGSTYLMDEWFLDMYRTKRCCEIHFDKSYEFLVGAQYTDFVKWLEEWDKKNAEDNAARSQEYKDKRAAGGWISDEASFMAGHEKTEAKKYYEAQRQKIEKMGDTFRGKTILNLFRESGVPSTKPWENQQDMTIPIMAKGAFNKSLAASNHLITEATYEAMDVSAAGGYSVATTDIATQMNRIVKHNDSFPIATGYKMEERDLTLDEYAALGLALYNAMLPGDWRLLCTEGEILRNAGYTNALRRLNFQDSWQAKMGFTEDFALRFSMMMGIVRPGLDLNPMDQERLDIMINKYMQEQMKGNCIQSYFLNMCDGNQERANEMWDEFQRELAEHDFSNGQSVEEWTVEWFRNRLVRDAQKSVGNYGTAIAKGIAEAYEAGGTKTVQIIYSYDSLLVPTDKLMYLSGSYTMEGGKRVYDECAFVTTVKNVSNVSETAQTAGKVTKNVLKYVPPVAVVSSGFDLAGRQATLDAHRQAIDANQQKYELVRDLVASGFDARDKDLNKYADEVIAARRAAERQAYDEYVYAASQNAPLWY